MIVDIKDWKNDLINAAHQRYNRALENNLKIAVEWKVVYDLLQTTNAPIYNPVCLPKGILEKSIITYILSRIMWKKESIDLPPRRINNLVESKRGTTNFEKYWTLF